MSLPPSGKTVRIQQRNKVATIGWDRIVPPPANKEAFLPPELRTKSPTVSGGLGRNPEGLANKPASPNLSAGENVSGNYAARRSGEVGSGRSGEDGDLLRRSRGPTPPGHHGVDGERYPLESRPAGSSAGPATRSGEGERQEFARRPARTLEMQEEFFTRLIQEKTPLRIICFEGLVVEGILKRTDTYGLLVETEGGEELLFKHGVIGIRPLPKTGRVLRTVSEEPEAEMGEKGTEEF